MASGCLSIFICSHLRLEYFTCLWWFLSTDWLPHDFHAHLQSLLMYLTLHPYSHPELNVLTASSQYPWLFFIAYRLFYFSFYLFTCFSYPTSWLSSCLLVDCFFFKKKTHYTMFKYVYPEISVRRSKKYVVPQYLYSEFT